MEKNGHFADFDNEGTYRESQERALLESTRNFGVQFGEEGADIAFDLHANEIASLISAPASVERPVRWINIWAPHQQLDIVRLLGEYYGFSPRLLAIISTAPPASKSQDKPFGRLRARLYRKDDIEVATTGGSDDTPRSAREKSPHEDISHYVLAEQMINYQGYDVGKHFFCIGFNFIHKLKPKAGDINEDRLKEGRQKRLYSWLILCDDQTVISLHEHPGQVDDREDLAAMRSNTLSVLSQLSNWGIADAISMKTVRQALKLDSASESAGVEGASLLFHYLFDDWRGVYSTVATYRKRLDELQASILDEVTRKNNSSLNIEIIPRLHILGRQIRQSQHLYEGYKNLIKRILEPKASPVHLTAVSRTSTCLSARPGSRGNGVMLAPSAAQRFERLGDRLELLILSETKEILAEKEALLSTYFNINSQRDSEATARLTRSATLLAKLSVLFLPVSLMTSYFSVQIQDLQGVYTVQDYWYSFAVLMSISFLSLFFFSRLLMYITETLEVWVKKLYRATIHLVAKTLRRRDQMQA
ncbi:hypothetical protein B2J93_4218 [Marssonina coronariae]|uniref:ADP-ribosylation factor n=1 Tax=Diplocarpon coronariae TaxID=2795749 RepID=A0A218ZAX0_9HELO|nr:hypothetical protein B2J93_4218 [Marssonina coronariae]